MGKRPQKSRREASSDAEDVEEDPVELLGKLARQRDKVCDTSRPVRVSVDRPSPRVNAILVANPLNPQELLLFGGERFDGKRCDFYGETFIFDLGSRQWTQINSPVAPSPRSAHQAVIIPNSGCVLIFGGEFGTSKETKFLHFGDTWIFDFATYTYRAIKMESHPPSRSGHRMAVHEHLVVLFGGFFDTSGQAKYLDDLWILDTRELRGWTRVDWMNEYESRPSARSGFSLVTHPEGVLLYGGYTQVKNKKGLMQGQTLNDLWLLRIDPSDLKTLRWKKLKLPPTAPPPRSGSSSVNVPSGVRKMLNFGGVIDEEVSDEFLLGTCVSDVYRESWLQMGFVCDLSNHSWSRVDVLAASFDVASFCGRFNAMLAPLSDRIVIFGGIIEVGDRQFTLDDMYVLDPASGRLEQLQSVSPEMQGCWNLNPSEATDSDADSDSDAETETEANSEDSTSSSGTESDDEPLPLVSDHDGPIAARHASLKEFFDSHVEYWMDAARAEHPGGEVTDKKLRSEAFLIAKRIWSEQQALKLDIQL